MLDNPKARPSLNPALRDFWNIPARNRILYGGRSSSKSWDAAGFAVFLACNYKIKFMCVRQFQNKIKDSVYSLLKIQIARFGLMNDFVITNSEIIHKHTGSTFIFYGINRHIDEIKSTEGIDVCWIEEAHGLTKTQWEILEPTVRAEGSQFWIVFNPDLVSDFVYKTFVTGTSGKRITGEIYGEVGATIKRKINYLENPFLSQTALDVIERKKLEDIEDYKHIYLGEPRLDDETSIIKRSWVRAAIDAHIKLGIEPSGQKRIGFDVGDGGDPNALVRTHGIVTLEIDEWQGREDELVISASRVHRKALLHRAEVDYDSIGIGGFVGGYFAKLNEDLELGIPDVEYFKFNAGDAVVNPEGSQDPNDPRSKTNKEFFANLKAQTWWHVGKLFQNTYLAIQAHEKGLDHDFEEDELLSISSKCDHIEDLIDELSAPKKHLAKNGKSKVESKEDLKKRDIDSPNKADAYIMVNAIRTHGAKAQMFLNARNR